MKKNMVIAPSEQLGGKCITEIDSFFSRPRKKTVVNYYEPGEIDRLGVLEGLIKGFSYSAQNTPM